MPNYVSNTFIVKGTKEQVNYFLSKGGFQTISDFNNQDAVAMALDNARLRSWLPLPQTFLDYDTTNTILSIERWRDKMYHKMLGDVEYKEDNTYDEYVRGYKEAKAEQKAIYGAVGWYQYNLKTLGTKWDAQIEVNTEETFEGNNNVTMYFDFDTAWYMPMKWFEFLCGKFYDLKFYIYGAEESGAFFRYYSNAIKNEDNTYQCIEELVLEKIDWEDEEAWIVNNDKVEAFRESFFDFVQNN